MFYLVNKRFFIHLLLHLKLRNVHEAGYVIAWDYIILSFEVTETLKNAACHITENL